MSLWSAIKARMAFPAWGGQATYATSTTTDWMTWAPTYAGSGYDYRSAAGNLWENAVVTACIAWIQRAFPEPQLQVIRVEGRTGEENAVVNHPLLMLLQKPNAHLDAETFWDPILSDFILTGNAYLLKVRNAAGQVIELWPVPCNRITPQWKPTGTEYIGSYRMVINGQPQPPIPPEDVVHFRFGKNPDNERLGWSPILAGLREIGALNEGGNYRGAILRKPMPAHLVTAEDPAKPLTKDQAERMEILAETKAGGDNRGRIVFSNIPLKALRLGLSPAELDLGKMLNWDADAVCALVGLSSMVVGISAGEDHKTYANYAEAKEAAFEGCIMRIQSRMSATLQLQLLPDFGDPDTERVRWDYSKVRILQEDESALWNRLDAAVKCGAMSRNEARALRGKPPVGDEGTPIRKSFDLPQPLLSTGFPYDVTPDWMPEPEPMPTQEPGQPESSGDAAAQAEQPGQAMPAGKALPPVGEVSITGLDVHDAEVLWREVMPPEYEGILSAEPRNGKR